MRNRRYIRITIFILYFCGTIFLSAGPFALNKCTKKFKNQRLRMVSQQIRKRGVDDPEVLEAMKKVERHRFVPQRYRAFAYHDRPLPIGYKQTISQPYIVALMTDLLELDKNDKVLEIGTGSGYQAAVLSEICDSVYTIEIIKELGLQAKKRLHRLGYNNINVKIGDGYQGWQEHSPYDGIIVTCAPPTIPEALKQQLAENGKMVIPVGDRSQELEVVRKKNGKIRERSVIPVRFVPMVKPEKQ
ncbi:MAG: protein-L-isoaspartate(D-aspartate) O-methyltransferase [Candidatus Marinimicrobia bacterium]|nr:protein-L-isoaspartate(D-aspartate) O-methyltransferase [Candidatus Neomarinimicrobiota bacterium]